MQPNTRCNDSCLNMSLRCICPDIRAHADELSITRTAIIPKTKCIHVDLFLPRTRIAQQTGTANTLVALNKKTYKRCWVCLGQTSRTPTRKAKRKKQTHLDEDAALQRTFVAVMNNGNMPRYGVGATICMFALSPCYTDHVGGAHTKNYPSLTQYVHNVKQMHLATCVVPDTHLLQT